MSTSRWNDPELGSDEIYQRKRLAVIKAASKAFQVSGFHGASLDQIARALNVTKTALYYYVKSKEEILYECHNIALDMGETALDDGEKTGGTAAERFHAFVESYVLKATSELGSCARLTDIEALGPKFRDDVVSRRDAFERRLRKLLQDGAGDGSMLPCDAKLTAFLIIGAIHWIPFWYNPEGPRTGAEIALEYADRLTDGLRQST